jgi:D-amino-acid oxidase
MSIKDPHRLSQGGHICYVIPRPGPEGHVILGGTTEKDVYSTLPDMEVAERILRDAFELCPDLAVDQSRGWEGIEVVAHNVGLRPAREGGMRLELEERKIGEGSLKGLMPKSGRENVGKEVGVVHAYGIGSAG